MTQVSHEAPLLAVEGLSKRYPIGGGVFSRSTRLVHAVENVSFTIARGETLGLVGESGSGKTTISKLIARLEQPTEGRIKLDGVDLAPLAGRALAPHRARVQMVFQDPYSSLDPRMSAGDIIEEPLLIQRILKRPARRKRVAELLQMVGLPTTALDRYPHEFSGGQRQRIGIARAIALNPDLLIADEPVSALDVSIQAQIINLLEDLQRDLGLSYLFIAHDLAVVRHIATRVAVLYLGRIMEVADRDTLYAAPAHPYTKALLAAAPSPDPDLEAARQDAVIEGEIPSPVNPPKGCVFSTRCPLASAECSAVIPELSDIARGHSVACIKVSAQSGAAAGAG